MLPSQPVPLPGDAAKPRQKRRPGAGWGGGGEGGGGEGGGGEGGGGERGGAGGGGAAGCRK